MKNLEIFSTSADETMNLAQTIAKLTPTKAIIVLSGELGSGKTKFTEGFLSYYGLQDEISSPTFNIVNEYTTPNSNIYHFDVYRLNYIDEFYEIGGEEYFDKGICLIEWGEIIKDALPHEYLHITFEKNNSNTNYRKIIFDAQGIQYEYMLDTLLKKRRN